MENCGFHSNMISFISSSYVCMVKKYNLYFVDTPRIFMKSFIKYHIKCVKYQKVKKNNTFNKIYFPVIQHSVSFTFNVKFIL